MICYDFIFSGERKYKCNLCKKAYKQHSQLSTHKKTHSRTKVKKKALSSCVSCGESYSSQKLLQRHLVEKHITVIS